MGIFSEFKEFAMKGNVVDLAVGVIIGAAFGKIVSLRLRSISVPESRSAARLLSNSFI